MDYRPVGEVFSTYKVFGWLLGSHDFADYICTHVAERGFPLFGFVAAATGRSYAKHQLIKFPLFKRKLPIAKPHSFDLPLRRTFHGLCLLNEFGKSRMPLFGQLIA